MSRQVANLTARLSELPLICKVLLANGLMDMLLPNPTTASPLLRAFDRQYRSKKKRGWAWLFLMCGLMKVHSSFVDPSTSASLSSWAFATQAVAIAMEGFFHKSIPRPTKVLGSTVCFCSAMWIWLQVAAWRHRQIQSTCSEGVPVEAELLEPSALPKVLDDGGAQRRAEKVSGEGELR